MRFVRHPVLSLGFRPFYLLAAIFAAVAIPIWMGIYLGAISPGSYLNGFLWHSHEMVFGFAVAVISGFLLTAVRNWTGLATPSGGPLAALVVLWLLGRVLMLLGSPIVAAVADFLFLPALGLSVAIPISRSRNRRNFKVIIVVAGLAMTNLSFHLAQFGVLPGGVGRLSIIVALDIIVILIVVIGGRVIPAFIGNAVPSAKPRHILSVEVLVFGSLLLILAAEISTAWYAVPGWIWFGLFSVAAISNIVRLLLWDPFKTRHNTLLLMLPVAYAWIPVSLSLRAMAELPLGISTALGLHALTIGAIASLMVAMMTRSALGHTGRTLKAGYIEIGAFLLLQLAAIMRILPGFIWPQHYQLYLNSSVVLWSLAFGIFLFGYWTALTRVRVDEAAS